jgi:hypothetical protein
MNVGQRPVKEVRLHDEGPVGTTLAGPSDLTIK